MLITEVFAETERAVTKVCCPCCSPCSSPCCSPCIGAHSVCMCVTGGRGPLEAACVPWLVCAHAAAYTAAPQPPAPTLTERRRPHQQRHHLQRGLPAGQLAVGGVGRRLACHPLLQAAQWQLACTAADHRPQVGDSRLRQCLLQPTTRLRQHAKHSHSRRLADLLPSLATSGRGGRASARASRRQARASRPSDCPADAPWASRACGFSSCTALACCSPGALTPLASPLLQPLLPF